MSEDDQLALALAMSVEVSNCIHARSSLPPAEAAVTYGLQDMALGAFWATSADA